MRAVRLTTLALGMHLAAAASAEDIGAARTSLENGRAYRKHSRIVNGLRVPTLSELRIAYAAESGPERKDSGDFLLDAVRQLSALLGERPGHLEARELLSQALNELLRGQSLLGNQKFRDALRIVYPVNLGDEPTPPEARRVEFDPLLAEQPAYEQAIADYERAVKASFEVLKHPETQAAVRGSGTAFPEFPQFTTIDYPPAEAWATDPENVLVETVQMTRAIRQWSLAHIAVASRLYLLAARDIRPGQELPQRAIDAKKILKRAGHGAFLQAAVLASKQDRETYQRNFGLEINSNIALARETFQALERRLPPTGRARDFISSSDVEEFVRRAENAVVGVPGIASSGALYWEREARLLSKAYDENNRTSYHAEMNRQRAEFKAPLEEISGIDVDNDRILVDGAFVGLNNLRTAADLARFGGEIRRRVGRMLASPAAYDPSDDQNDLGTLSAAIRRIVDAKIVLDRALDDLRKIPRLVEIEERRAGAIAIALRAEGESVRALELALAVANSLRVTSTITTTPVSPWLSSSVAVTVDPGAIPSALLRNQQRLASELRELATLAANREAEINKLLLGISTALFNIESARSEMLGARSAFEQEYARMERLVDDLRRAQVVAADAWFNDPAYDIELEVAQIRAQDTLVTAIAALYDLAKAMGYVWSEDYVTPVKDLGAPPRVTSVAYSGSDFWEFTSVDDVFTITSAQSCADGLEALRNWDSILRNGPTGDQVPYRGTRGSNVVARPLSLRRDLLNLESYPLHQQVLLFRDFLARNSFLNGSSFLIQFPMRLEVYQYDTNTRLFVNPHFDFNAWNQTVEGIAVEIDADAGFLPNGRISDVVQVWLAITGETTKRTYFGRAQTNSAVDGDEALKRITVPEFQQLDLLTEAGLIDRSNKFIDGFLARVEGGQPIGGWPNGYQPQDGSAVPHFRLDSKLRNLPVGATGWFLVISAADTQNLGIDISKLRDVRIFVRYNAGPPPPIFEN